MGNQSHPKRLADHRKRVLRGAGVTLAAKRRQRVCRPCDLASKWFSVVGVDAVQTAEDYIAAPLWLGSRDPTGVEEQGAYTRGSPETWEVLSFPRSTAGRGYRITNLRPALPRPQRRSETGPHPWYRQTKETKCGGMDGRNSEPRIVPSSTGNASVRTRGREGAAEQRNRWRERCQRHRALITSQRNNNG